MAKKNTNFISKTDVVDEPSKIGEGSKIWHFSHVSENAAIGANCSIGQNVFVGKGVSIGYGCKVQNNVSVYEGVTLEDRVFCGPSMVFTNVINPRAEIERKHEFKKTLIRQGVTIGANATIVCGVTIGRYAFIGAGAVVTKDVPDFALVIGNPARQTGTVCMCAEKLPDGDWTQAECAACHRSYRRDGSVLRLSGE